MRQILSISLPEKVAQKIKTLSKKRGYPSVSQYIHNLIELDQNLITETELLESVDEARKEYAAGKTLKANSIADVL